MERTMQIIIGILVIAVAALGYQQWKLEKLIEPVRRTAGQSASSTPDIAMETRSQLMQQATTGLGKVVSIGAGKLVVEVTLVDLDKLSTVDFVEASTKLPTVTKQVALAVPSTVNLSALKVGDTVTIQTRQSIYSAGPLEALSVLPFVEPK